MHSVKLLFFLLGIFLSSASEIVSKTEYDHEIRKIYEKLEILDELWKENKVLKENIQSLQKENVEFQDAIVSLESDVDKLKKEILELNSKGTVHNSLNSKSEEKPNADFLMLQSREVCQNYYIKGSQIMKTMHTRTVHWRKGYGHYPYLSLYRSSSRDSDVFSKQHRVPCLQPKTSTKPRYPSDSGVPYCINKYPSSSISRAPADGLYYFSVTILSFQGEDIEVEIVHNGNGMVYTYSGGETMYGSGSTAAVLQLHANDDVWIRILNVRIVNDGNVRVFEGKWSSFCGFKIA